MISKNPICFSKKIIYLVLLIIICGLLLIVNSTGKVNTYKTKANTVGAECGVTGYFALQDTNFSSMYYDEYCRQYEDKPLWNGLYGNKAKCYTTTAVCSRSSICPDVNCIAGISESIRCLNKEVNIQTCISYNKAPVEAGENFNCPPPGEQLKYTWMDSRTCYMTNGRLIPSNNSGSRPYCAAKRVEDINLCKCFVNGVNCPSLTQTPTPILTLTPTPMPPSPTQIMSVNTIINNCSLLIDKIARRYINYEGRGLDGCITYSGLYYSRTKINPVLDPNFTIRGLTLSGVMDWGYGFASYCSTNTIVDCRILKKIYTCNSWWRTLCQNNQSCTQRSTPPSAENSSKYIYLYNYDNFNWYIDGYENNGTHIDDSIIPTDYCYEGNL